MNSSCAYRYALTFLLILSFCTSDSLGQSQVIPHAQDTMPGPALSPAEAIAKMKVPPGFRVECFASEPDLVNPVAMAIDEKGRVWVTESLEYPRREPGIGKDRVKVLEDTDGDGKADKVTIFAEGLNIPSGIAVGHGGVWVANSPDILFLKDTDGDGKADSKEVIVTGFGRDDTHELPNSLTWGPDGWLYGLNGVFNPSVIKHRGKEFAFTCALFRIHPKTREFQVFCEGTSNPWGVAFNENGSAFVSACVIDHLWHLVESAYYLRQGGPYPPFTWHLQSIVKHKHQKAAYCGITWFDSPAFPEKYREKLYMGNIHGGCINSDRLEKRGSTYFGLMEPDFLTANDQWFMPVVQKTGPDGCLWILDWYDRYHCYQDANRDPKGIDRLRGRLYRVVYERTQPIKNWDLGKKSKNDLIAALGDPNVFIRETAQRLLCEKGEAFLGEDGLGQLETLVKSNQTPRKHRLHALWTLGSLGKISSELEASIAKESDSTFRAWLVRFWGNQGTISPTSLELMNRFAAEADRDVQLQVIIAAAKINRFDPLPIWQAILRKSGDDPVIAGVLWQNLHPRMPGLASRWLDLASQSENAKLSKTEGQILARLSEKLLSQKPFHPESIEALFRLLTSQKEEAGTRQFLNILALRLETGEIGGESKKELKQRLLPSLGQLSGDPKQTVDNQAMAAITLALFGDPVGLEKAKVIYEARDKGENQRRRALQALLRANGTLAKPLVIDRLNDPGLGTPGERGRFLLDLALVENDSLAEELLNQWKALDPEVQARLIDLVSGKPKWAKALMARVVSKAVPTTAINANTARKLIGFKDAELTRQVTQHWGVVREGRNPERENLVRQMTNQLRSAKGNPANGPQLFQKVCAQCHKIYGQGQEVGPEITSNGRASFEQLVSNVFDPSLVIGTGYLATTVTTNKGKIFTGLLVEDSPDRVVLKVQGGTLETIPRTDLDELKTTQQSLMPEGMEKQLTPQEWADLFAFLCLDRPPGDPKAKKIPGSP